jgi:hypothetical protein
MGDLFGLLFPWGIALQALAIVHFVRRRPETFWLWIILFFGPLGALVYIFVEVLPDATLLRGSFEAFPRRRRIRQLERLILDNPSSGNLEELADLYLDDGDMEAAVTDLSRVVTHDPKYDFHRAAGLLAHACGRLGHHEEAEAWFKQATALSTASELAIHYAEFLEQARRPAEAREWAQRVLDKKATMPSYLRRRERPWFRRAKAVLKRAS